MLHLPHSPKRHGWRFSGWALASEGISQCDGNNAGEGDVKLQAREHG